MQDFPADRGVLPIGAIGAEGIRYALSLVPYVGLYDETGSDGVLAAQVLANCNHSHARLVAGNDGVGGQIASNQPGVFRPQRDLFHIRVAEAHGIVAYEQLIRARGWQRPADQVPVATELIQSGPIERPGQMHLWKWINNAAVAVEFRVVHYAAPADV